MTATADALGRRWPHEKLDRLLADEAVARTVAMATLVGHHPPGTFDAKRVWAWGKREGRSRPGIALLLLLCWHRVVRELETEA